MAIELFSKIWTVEDDRLIPTLKLVLLSFADQADAVTKVCWPSYTYVAKRCNQSERNLMRNVQRLCELGFMRVKHRPNQTNLYKVYPAGDAEADSWGDNLSPAGVTPVSGVGDAGVTSRGDAGVTLTISKPSKEPSTNVKGSKSKALALACPLDVDAQIWGDFLILRKEKKAPMTETALKGIQREAERAGLTLQQALETCCQRGWQGFKADWMKEKTYGKSGGNPGRQDSGATAIFAELQADFARGDL